MKIYPTTFQKKKLDEFIDTSRYVYNKTLEYINNGHKIDFQGLRDILVTENTKKGLQEYKDFDDRINNLKALKKNIKIKEEQNIISEEIKAIQQERRDVMKYFEATKNEVVNDFELQTPKDVRTCAVKRCCDAFKTGFSNLKNGNIKHFKMKFKKKSEKRQTVELSKKNISISNNKIKILPTIFKDECYLQVSKNNAKQLKGFKITNNVDIIRFKNQYYIHFCVQTKIEEEQKESLIATGIDLGIRTFATCYSNNITTNETFITEYEHDNNKLKSLNQKIDNLKCKRNKKRVRKRLFNKTEKQKEDLVDKLHWDFINHVLKHNDVLYVGDIKSHDIVNGGKNKILNRCFNDLKFFVLKQRLIYKAGLKNKKVIYVKEHYTTKTCSCCGQLNNVGCSKTFNCKNCKLETGRDMNASKNIMMRGFYC